MKTKMYLLGTEIDMTIDGWAKIVMDKLDDAHARNAYNDLSVMAYAILAKLQECAPRPTDIQPLDPADYRGGDYGDDDADEDDTIPRAVLVDNLFVPAESKAMMDREDNCTHPNMGFSPDRWEDGERVEKHHWYCEDCGHVQVG